jgi:hypothetical protein
MSQYSAAEHSGTQKATENGLNVVRFYTGELRFHLKKRKFLAQTEIVSALSATQSSSARLGAVFHWGFTSISFIVITLHPHPRPSLARGH